MGLVEAGAQALFRKAAGGSGSSGTSSTINIWPTRRIIKAFKPDASIFAQACPLLVPLVEEGWHDDEDHGLRLSPGTLKGLIGPASIPCSWGAPTTPPYLCQLQDHGGLGEDR